MWVAVLMVSFLVIYCTQWFYRWRTPGAKGNGVLPPGSMGLPFLGETLSLLIPSYSLDLHPFVRKRIQRYGPIFRTSFIGRRVVVSADPEINSYLFSQEGKLVELWYLDTFNKLLSLEGENRITGPGLIHKYMRSSLRNHLSPEALKEKLPQLVAWIDKTLLHWCTKPSVEIKHAVSAMVLEFTARFLCGYDVDKAPVDISEKIATLTKGLTSLPLNIPGTAFHKCLKDQEKVITMITNMLKERRAKEAEEEKEEDFLDQAIKDLRTENYLTEDFIVRLLYGFLFASFESIGTVMCLGFKLLAEHPEVMEELAAEHEAILKNRADSDSSLTWEDYKSLTFTPHVVSEILRLTNNPPGLLRRAIKDIEIKGYTIPADWTIMVVNSTLHLDPVMYKDPLAFNPWRWKDLDSYTVAKNFTPFGGGSRQCAGAEYSKVVLATFLHVVVSKYRWTIIKGGRIARRPLIAFGDGIHIRFSQK
ncbi:hypothetical protein PS2_044176 [Malus domestica]|uniref:Cytochrome P450 n=1 Tax=Malus domestica TaxID=3750 RepID=A0A498JBM8_MALDO|nr:cytochrome P450 87A3-like [Malus domestica]RXH92197.1 hypothetical protein DVH24_033093 [Malus domestica]